jgi:SAM-dependent methyltransferase
MPPHFQGFKTSSWMGAILGAMPKKSRSRSIKKTPSRKKRKPILTKANSDRHLLYQDAVQCPEAELDFVDRVFKTLRARKPLLLREDFCGTGHTSCEWVRRRPTNTAVGLDLDAPTLAWGLKHNVSTLTPEQRSRLKLLRSNVLTPPKAATNVDAVLAMNFSWWIFHERPLMLEYYKAVRQSLARDGVFFLDICGGWEMMKTHKERRRCRGFTYVWEQSAFNPIDNSTTCKIHFDFKRGPMWKNAFTYHWRVWTLPEVCDMLIEAGFKKPTVYWEGDTASGSGNGVFRPQRKAEDCASFVAFVVAGK